MSGESLGESRQVVGFDAGCWSCVLVASQVLPATVVKLITSDELSELTAKTVRPGGRKDRCH